ncbi:phosphotransferase [Cytobacillus horneckiae]|uniref:Phosphotransferase n=1 Tax=Cytobacillus horneckiae TaxID=549687 RepID=A0A2N0Z9V1_9BACI|nr:phosphotransferase [Cytobacillus horneckiae]MEC1158364.1 phosphotransferase [Cytobacillus horneckiae]MED2937363.1 phosphotransferase [Cytobacillus horneckiae]PKG26281.1 phosphotransferase [Cytobacillus horneckiae]
MTVKSIWRGGSKIANLWDSEFEISAQLAKKVIEEQFPFLKPAAVHRVGSGWDNTIFLANDCYMFRFPRRKAAVPLIVAENHVLPQISAYIEGEVAISLPIYKGMPSEVFPYPFSGYVAIVGQTTAELAITEKQRIAIAQPMATFLKKLHEIPFERLNGVGPDTIGRLDLTVRAPKLEKELAILEDKKLIAEKASYIKIIEQAKKAEKTKEAFVHGDLYFRNFLVAEKGNDLAGIIDWGDLHIGNPAVDLAVAFSFFPLEGRKLFFETYGTVDGDTYCLARFRGLYVMSYLVFYGMDIQNQQIIDEALLSLKYIIDE